MKAIVLSSGGVDSTTCLAIAINDADGADNVTSVCIDYGQRHRKEMESSRRVAQHYGVTWKSLDLSQIWNECGGCLLDRDSEVPEGTYEEQVKENGSVATEIPFRNGVFLSVITAYAMSLYPGEDVAVYLGNHADDYEGNTYPDCSPEFTKAMQDAIRIGSRGRVRFRSPLVNCDKTEVVSLGIVLDVPYELTWSCYKGGDKACGKCATCLDRLKAFRNNGTEDPIEYEE